MRARKRDVLILAILLGVCAVRAAAEDAGKRSKTVTSVLREPLPPEELNCRSSAGEIVIEGATFTYTVKKANGAVSSLQVRREGEVVVRLDEPVDVLIDDYRLACGESSAGTDVVSRGDEQVVLKTEGVLREPEGQRPDLPYSLVATFYNDGVAVFELKLLPRQDVLISKGMRYHLAAKGRFSHYIHKRRDENGSASSWGDLPEAGKSVTFATLTSCLEAFSPEAALAIFTDGGGIHLAAGRLETAVLGVKTKGKGQASVSLDQHMVTIDRGGEPYLLQAGTEFTVRVGISIAPNRLPHPRRHDLRHYVWIGDQKHPYPTDGEILDAARLGYTLFQMHRVGAPGEPRPPAGELERVINKVHEAGMLFIWEVNADLIYASLKRVSEMQEDGTWPLWQGFNYGGRYRASMDPYCDLVATCLASPNGLTEFRLECLTKMMEKYDVDGVYVDDNLAYANCPLWKEHGHPRKVYDCLIELHEMNWRRRQLLRKLCPHVVLIDHCTKALILPVICDFDVHLYGEGYGFSSLESYWSFFGSINSMYAQGNIWAGDTEGSRCATAVAYNYDLLTGGGQYTYTDWRLYPEEFPYANGVTREEPLIVRTYNLPQCYFGMYESTPYYFATSADVFSTTAPLTYATAYRNRVWEDYLIPMANMSTQEQRTSLVVHAPERLGVSADGQYLLYDVSHRTTEMLKGEVFAANGIGEVLIPGQGLRLFYVRKLPEAPVYHLWGGKRIRETWDSASQRLTFEVHGPLGLQETALVGVSRGGVAGVTINGERAEFFFDPSRRLAHGTVTFSHDPVTVEVTWSPDNRSVAAEYKWTEATKAAAFSKRDGAGAATYNGKMWLLGGWADDPAGGSGHVGYNDVWNSTNGLNWTQVRPNTPNTPSVWEGRHCGGYVVFNNKMWIVGGDPLLKHYQNDVWSSADGANWQQATANAPWGQRNMHVTMVHDGKIWVMGGQTVPQFVPDVPEAFYNDVWNSSDGVNWTQVTAHAAWSPRGMIQGSAEFNGRMRLLGGGTYDTPAHPTRLFYNEVWSSADGVNWREDGVAPWAPRQYHSVAVFDNKMWVMAGGNSSTPGYNRNDVWHSSDGVNWTELPNTPWPPRHAGTAFVCDGHLWMVAGSHPGSTPINDVWRLDTIHTP